MNKTHNKASDILRIPFFGARKALNIWRYLAFRIPFIELKIVQLKRKKGEFLEVDRQCFMDSVPPVKLQNKLPENFRLGLVKDLRLLIWNLFKGRCGYRSSNWKNNLQKYLV